MSVIRGTSLLGYPELVSSLGGDPEPLLRSVKIKPSACGDYDSWLGYAAVVRAIEGAAAATGTSDFGRQLATRQGIEILGAVGVAARTAPTVGEALQICSTYLSAYSPAVAVALHPTNREEHTFFEFRIVVDGLAPYPQTVELALGITLNVLRFLRGADYRPLGVTLPHAAMTPAEDYQDYYRCPPQFDHQASGFVLRTSDLAAPLSDDGLAHDTIVRYLDTIVGDVDSGLVRPVSDLVRRLLPTGAVSMELVAGQLGLHPKTLQRRLGDEGTTFGSLVEGVRREQAERYLRDTELGLTQVALQLGYAEQSVLTRSCRRWFGQAPAALRAHLRERAAVAGA